MTRRRGLRRAALLLAGTTMPLVWLLTAPAEGAPLHHRAAAPGHTVTAPDAIEAWYASAPIDLCSTPLGCPPEQVPTSPYPADTLHVGVAGGQETARTYLLPDLTRLPFGAIGVTGVMTLPIGSGSQDGSQSVDAAHLKACLAIKPVTDGTQGSTAKPPDVDCSTTAAPVYDAKHNVFTLDVTVFLAEWTSGALPYGIALVPDLDKGQPTDAWHVAFNGRHRAKADHITTTISFTPPPPVSTAGNGPAVTPTQQPTPPPVDTSGGGVSLPPVASGAQPPVAPAPQVAPPAQPAVVAQPVALARGFQYPMAFLAPLALLAAALFFGRLFTRDPLPMRARG